MKLKEKFTAIQLRKEGHSYPKILKTVNVSKSTLSLWLRDIDLTPQQQKKLLRGREISRYAAAKKKKELRILKTNEIIKKGKEEIKDFIDNSLFTTGLALYWSEGAKNSSESVRFANSDEFMIKLIMRWFREICNVPEKKFRVQVHMHELHCSSDLEGYWSRVTGIPSNQFYRTYVKKTSLGQRRNILYNGTCSVTISNKELFRKIMGWKLGIQKYFNISP